MLITMSDHREHRGPHVRQRLMGRRGTVVAEASADPDEDARRTAADFVRRMRALGISPTRTVQLVRQAFDG